MSTLTPPTAFDPTSHTEKQLRPCAVLSLHLLSRNPWEYEKQKGFYIYDVTSCHMYHEVCNRAQDKSYYFSAYTY